MANEFNPCRRPSCISAVGLKMAGLKSGSHGVVPFGLALSFSASRSLMAFGG
jgi:hypothetical protein